MSDIATRREFLQVTAAGGAVGGWLAGTGAGWSSSLHAADDEPQPSAASPERRAVEAEIRGRARWQLEQTRLIVDYYRVGRKIAYPLPLPELVIPEVLVPSIAVYPWATWLLWTLEERIDCLGWTAQWFGDEQARLAATADLAALARWPTYQQYTSPDLSSAHAGRILWTASTRWGWLNDDLRRSVREACVRHVEAVLPASDKLYASVRTKEDVLGRESPHTLLHNIPLIGTVGAALTATAVGHSAAAVLNARVQALFGAVLDLRSQGYSEGVAYDGYVLDFVADWLAALPAAEQSAILDHPNLNHYLEQSYMLGAPGAIEQVAELSDVEPRQMPFHLSAQAKLLQLQRHPLRSWLMARCPLDVLRSNGLVALRDLLDMPSGEEPPAGALESHYAAVLRSGWESEDLAVAVACSTSPMGHIQSDSGTLVIGTGGNWLVTDPGYQQYVRGEEREFTVGAAAHNAPLINNHAPSLKRPRKIVLEAVSPSVRRVAVDLTQCYAAEASLNTLVRHVWLSNKNLVVVADQVEAAKSPQAIYHWHAAPTAAWWFEDGWALVAQGNARLWLACSQGRLAGADLHRLSGSRGQLTLVSTIDGAGPVVWWAFALTPERPTLHVEGEGRQIRLLDQTFRI
ncbi:MAG: hypothetical protein GXY83_39745 [Rhodopirellula sp.]|nr:hypothetical protein [Rhodopirellula sp.]